VFFSKDNFRKKHKNFDDGILSIYQNNRKIKIEDTEGNIIFKGFKSNKINPKCEDEQTLGRYTLTFNDQISNQDYETGKCFRCQTFVSSNTLPLNKLLKLNPLFKVKFKDHCEGDIGKNNHKHKQKWYNMKDSYSQTVISCVKRSKISRKCVL